MKLSIIDRAFYRLKGYCEKKATCEGYRFNKENNTCELSQGIPADWEMPGKGERDNG